jgi:XTP/dITP diphosphohydrolase
MSRRLLVLGTRNRKKGLELSELLAPFDFELKTLLEIPESIEVDETGDSFLENAHLKASEQARHLNQWVIGEDSGLRVDSLDGAPGIYSARFSGEDATDEKNNRHLLEKLGEIPLEKRTAHYVCHMSLSNPQGEVLIDCEEYCRGRIRFDYEGSGGFGYDPLFEVVEYHMTFGTLGGSVKKVLSHRSRAIRKFVPELLGVVERGEWPIPVATTE